MASNVPSQPPLAGKDGDIDFERAFIEQQSMAHGYTGNMFSRETTSQKVKRLFKEDPMVPIGTVTPPSSSIYMHTTVATLSHDHALHTHHLAQGWAPSQLCLVMACMPLLVASHSCHKA